MNLRDRFSFPKLSWSLRRPAPGWARRWLPTPGNLLLTLVVVAALLWASSAGAFPLRALSSTSSTSINTIAYQGRLADSSGNPLTGTYNMEFRIYSQASGGTYLWAEMWTGANSVQVSDGLFNVMLGSLTSIPENVISGNSTLWLGITVNTDSEMQPRVQLGTVPYAVEAQTVPDGTITTAKFANDAAEPTRLQEWLGGSDTSFDAKNQGSSVTTETGITISVPSGKAYYYLVIYSGTLRYFYGDRVASNPSYFGIWDGYLLSGQTEVAKAYQIVFTGYRQDWSAVGGNNYWDAPFETTWVVRLEAGTHQLKVKFSGYSDGTMNKAHLAEQRLRIARLY